MADFSPTPFKDVPIISADEQPSSRVRGYRLVSAPKGFFCQPEPRRIGCHGWLAIAGLALLCWPLMCLPCCMSCSYPAAYQVPVYEYDEVI